MVGKLLFVFCCFLCFRGITQSELYVLMKIPQNNTGRSGSGACAGRLGDYDYNYSISHRQGKYSITTNEVNVTIDYQEGYNDDPGFGCNGRCGQYETYCDNTEFDRDFVPFYKYKKTYTGPEPIECGAETCLPISYDAILLPRIEQPLDKKCETQQLFSNYSDGNNHNVTGLTWEYLNSLGRWEEVPSFKNRYPLNVSLLDVFGSNWRNRFNGNLQLRFKFKTTFTSDTIYSINNYTIELTECSPKLVSKNPTIKNDRCNYSKEGTFTMILNRDLVENENLIVSLYDENTSSSVPTNRFKFFKQQFTSDLIPNLNTTPTTYSYTWEGVLDAGNYNFRYQTVLDGREGISDSDDSWRTAEFSNNFEIKTPKNIKYAIKSTKEETCKGARDGEMVIEILDGEDLRSYKYTLYEVNGSTVIEVSGKKNVIFTGLSTTITGLTQKKYRVKIQDNQGCFAR